MRIISENNKLSVNFDENSVLTIQKGNKQEGTWVLCISDKIGSYGKVLGSTNSLEDAISLRKFIEGKYMKNKDYCDLSTEKWQV